MHNLLPMVTAVLMLCVVWNSAQANEIELSGPTEKVSEGYFNLEVEGLDDGQRFVVEMSTSAAFDSVEREFEPLGVIRQLSLSGFDDGTYYFRARAGESYSNTVAVRVSHYPLWHTLALFIFGLLVFAILVYTTVYFYRRSKS